MAVIMQRVRIRRIACVGRRGRVADTDQQPSKRQAFSVFGDVPSLFFFIRGDDDVISLTNL